MNTQPQVAGDGYSGILSKNFSGVIKITPAKSARKRQSAPVSDGEFTIKFLVTDKANEFRLAWQTFLSWKR